MKDDVKTGFGPSLGPFDWEDPFRLVDQLEEDERLISDAARTFAQTKLLPRVTEAYANETIAPEVFAEMGEAGLLGGHDEQQDCQQPGHEPGERKHGATPI